MSRGIGLLQQSIIREVKEPGNGLTTFETLRWTLWSGTASSNVNLPQAWNTSVDRAVRTLTKRGDLSVESRPLANLNEWVAHYPGKSLNIQIHELRKEFLPHIVAWLRSGDGPGAKFSKAQNEEFAARNLAPEQVEALRSLWANLVPSLREYYGKTGKEHLLLLLVRGKQLFIRRWPRVSTTESLGDLVTSCNTDPDMPGELRDQLQVIKNKFLPGAFANTLEFKSYIRAVAKQIPTSGHCALSEEAEDALYQRCANRLSQLPGFKPAHELKSADFLYLETKNGRPQHSLVLRKLLDHSVFQHFRFLTA